MANSLWGSPLWGYTYAPTADRQIHSRRGEEPEEEERKNGSGGQTKNNNDASHQKLMMMMKKEEKICDMKEEERSSIKTQEEFPTLCVGNLMTWCDNAV